MSLKKILFVCLGNICRSPAAEGVMRRMVDDAGLEDRVVVDSAGIGSWHVGEQPDRRMCRHAMNRGYDLTVLRARQFKSEDFHRFDYIVVMDEENYHDVMQRMPSDANYSSKVLRMKDYLHRYNGHTSVPDPYYGGAEGFELALDLIEDGCRGLLDSLMDEFECKTT